MAAPNKLIAETSPYLLQHAHNPVHWYPWGEEALQEAKQQDKPILVSIGYSSCHWCHVMERESFEDAPTAAIMNQHFINIKIDREERPDLDHIYMDAVTAMTGSGGWPLNVFLTPDLKPFYGGTYFPPVRAYNRASWKEVLHGIAAAYRERKSDIELQATELTKHLENANAFGAGFAQSESTDAQLYAPESIHTMFENIMKTADLSWGGFGTAPKFPQTFTIKFLLRYAHFTGNQDALQHACRSLDKMLYGGIYDHVGGGFARYSTDAEWLVPHFEKMLYDNALLVMVLSEAFQLTGLAHYERVIHETLTFIDREMTSPEGGFYAALDADSEGVEGKYYVWTYDEVCEALKEDASLFCAYYDITPEGNWEHENIPWVKISPEDFCAARVLDLSSFLKKMQDGLQRLKTLRDQRIRPLLDDKIILGWNALMNIAYSAAFAATGNESYRTRALSNMDFLLRSFAKQEGGFFHVYKAGNAKFPAFLDDLSALMLALIRLQEITSDTSYLEEAKKIIGYLNDQFSDQESPFYFYSPSEQQDVLVRKKEVYDGAVPSGNAMACAAKLYLGTFYTDSKMLQEGIDMLAALHQGVMRHPGSFGLWASEWMNLVAGLSEISILGKDFEQARDGFVRRYVPNKVFASAETAYKELIFNTNHPIPDQGVFYYLCRNQSCLPPVVTEEALMGLLHKNGLSAINDTGVR